MNSPLLMHCESTPPAVVVLDHHAQSLCDSHADCSVTKEQGSERKGKRWQVFEINYRTIMVER